MQSNEAQQTSYQAERKVNKTEVKPLNISHMPLHGQQIIEASAGTGKTYNITRIFLKLLLEKRTPVEKILIVTYTKAATEELKGRIASQTNELLFQLSNSPDTLEGLFVEMIANIPSASAPDASPLSAQDLVEKRFEHNKNEAKLLLKKAALYLDEASIFTIHSFCQRVIKQTAFMSQQAFSPEIIHSSAPYSIEEVQDWFRRNQSNTEIIEVLKTLGLIKPSRFYREFKGAIEGFKPLTLIPEKDQGFDHEITATQNELENLCKKLNALKKQVIDEQLVSTCSLIADFKQAIYAVLNEQADSNMLDYFQTIESWLFSDVLLLGAKTKFTKPLKTTIAKKYFAALEDKRLITTYANQIVALGDTLVEFNTQYETDLKQIITFQKQLVKLENEAQNQVKRSQYSLIKKAIEEIRSNLHLKKEKLGVIDHDDTIHQLSSAVSQNNETVINYIQHHYPYALIDEFQDTDKAQFSIFSRCYPKDSTHHLLVMIGDPKQAIYGFRGGDINTYLSAYQNAYPKYSMQHNFRSSQAMIDAYNILFYGQSILPEQLSIANLKALLPQSQQDQSQVSETKSTPTVIRQSDSNTLNSNPVFGDEISYPWIYSGAKAVDDSLTGLVDSKKGALVFQINETVHHNDLFLYENEKPLGQSKYKTDQAKALAQEIIRLCKQAKIDGQPVELKDIAVLVAAKGEAETVQTELRNLNIPSVYLSSKTNIYESKEAKSLLIALDGILHANHNQKFFRALSTDLLGYRPQQLVKLQGDNHLFDHVKNMLFDLRKMWERKGIFALINHLIKQHFRPQNRYSTNERILTNYTHLAELLNTQSKVTEHAYQLLNWLQKQIPDYSDERQNNDGEETHQRLESDDELVKIVTLHGSKGLEYPIVFIPFAGFDPQNYRSDHLCQFTKISTNESKQVEVQIGTDRAAANAQQKEWEEEQMRLLYVGITRAIHRCYLGVGRFSLLVKSPLFDLVAKQIINKEAKALLNQTSDIRTSKHIHRKLSEYLLSTLAALALKEPSIFALDKYQTEDNQNATETQDFVEKDPVYNEMLDEQVLSSTFLGNTDSVWQLSSFSKVSKQSAHVDLGDKGKSDDRGDSKKHTVEDSQSASHLDLRFSIERSADTGNLLHNLLEDHDFSEEKTLKIEHTNEHLTNYLSGNRSCNIDALNNWLNEIISTPLPSMSHKTGETLCTLNSLKTGHILKEPEFYFPISSINTHDLISLMQLHRREVSGEKALPFSIYHADLNGMMHGFIDLLFEYNGKFYVADYKSNHVGNNASDYQNEHMKHAIQSHLYDLQYLIYSWALDRFLSHRLGENYERSQHFGGVYYLFLRGMSPRFPLGTGIYQTPLSAATWQGLDSIFTDNGSTP